MTDTDLTPQEHAINRTSATKHGLVIIALMILAGGTAGYLLVDMLALHRFIEIPLGVLLAAGVAHTTAHTYARIVETLWGESE